MYLGTSGWAYPSWKPGFYPPKTPAKKMLSYYSSQLNSVEVNYTFRQLPKPAMVEGWMAETPEGFRFSFKAPQTITHLRRLKNCGDAIALLQAALLSVEAAGRLGVVLCQLPPNFKADLPRLHEFLESARTSRLRLAFEFRDASWFCEETYAVLKEHVAALCVAESDELQTPRRRTAPYTCYRLRKSSYTAAELKKVRDQLLADAASGDVFAYFKHEDAPDGPLRARKVLTKVREA